MLFIREGQSFDPTRSVGGGVVDVAAFALRMACLSLARPQRRRLLILDEPFRFVSRGYRPRLRALLQQLTKDMGIQIVMVTHLQDLVVGKVVEIE